MILLIIFSLACGSSLAQTTDSTAILPVNLQLEGYNNRNINQFLSAYSDSVKVFMYPNKFLYKGLEQMRKTYSSMFDKTPDLYCEIINRTVLGNIVIDHEKVITDKNKPPFQAIAIYKIHGGKISEVRFLYPD